MGRRVPLLLGALGIMQQLGALGQEIPPCIDACAGRLRADFAKLGCASANDAGCLCAKPDFSYGIRDCGASCGATDANVRQYLVGGFCTAVLPASLTQTTTTTSQSATASSAESSPTSNSASSITSSETSTSSSTTSAPSTAAQATSSATPSTPLASSSATASASATQSSHTSSAIPSVVQADATPSPTASGEPSGNGLPQAAVIGIGVGTGAAVVAIAGVVVCMLMRGRKVRNRQSMSISKPLPGSGRTYADRVHGYPEKHTNDIELSSNRYEDMVPRQLPRTLV